MSSAIHPVPSLDAPASVVRRGLLFVVSAPSGAGKSTIAKRLLSRMDLGYSVSTTTRPPRPTERDGIDYDFVSPETFDALAREGVFAEHALVHGHRYGTRKDRILGAVAAGRDVLLDIDVQGARSIRASMGHGIIVLIFIQPPSFEVLESRLRARKTETEEVLKTRLDRARLEMDEVPWYDYAVVNDDLEAATRVLEAIVLAERHRVRKDS